MPRFCLFLLGVMLLSSCDDSAPPAPTPQPEAAAEAPSAPIANTLAAGKYLASRFADDKNNVADALVYNDAVLSDQPENILLLRQRFQLKLQRPETDRDALTRLALQLHKQQPDDLQAKLWLMTAAIRSGDFPGADALLQELQVQDQQAMRQLAALLRQVVGAWLQLGMDNDAAANQLLLPEADKQHMTALLATQRAYMKLAQGDNAAARSALSALRGNLVQPTVRALLLEILVAAKAGQSSTAAPALEKLLSTNAQAELINTLLNAGLAGDSRWLGIPDTVQRGIALALFDIAVAFKEDNSRETAFFFARLSHELDADSGFTALLLADILSSQRRQPQAIAFLDYQPKSSPFWPFVQLESASIELQLKQHEAAEKRLKTISSEAPSLVSATIELANFYRGKERFADALMLYKKALEQPAIPAALRWGVLFGIGICEERLKNWPAAEKALKDALVLRPDEPHVLNYLGYSWVEQGVHLDEALGLLERAAAAAPNDGYITDSLGWAHFRRGHFDKAVPLLEKAVELLPADPILNDHLGDAYWRVGRQREAYFQWQRSLRLNPKPEDAQKTTRKLEGGLDAAAAEP